MSRNAISLYEACFYSDRLIRKYKFAQGEPKGCTLHFFFWIRRLNVSR